MAYLNIRSKKQKSARVRKENAEDNLVKLNKTDVREGADHNKIRNF